MGSLLCGEALVAQTADPFADISASGLLYQASKSLAMEDYASAVPYLNHYLERMGPIEEARVMALKQSVRLKLGKIYAYMEDPFTASDYLTEYTQSLPCYRPREAWRLLALTLYESGQFEPCIEAVEQALTRPEPKALPRSEKEVSYDELSKDQMAGFSARQMKRIEEEAKEAEDGIGEAISEDIPDPEPDYTIEELVFLHMTLAEAHTELEQWESSVDPYQYVVEHAVASDRKGYAIMQLVNALIALERYDEAKDFIVKLYRTNARYDVRVNMALVSAASELFNVAKYDSALMLYRMILPRDTMVDYQVKKMDEIRREAGLPRVELQITTNDMGRVQTVFGNQSSELSVTENTFAKGLPPKPEDLLQLEAAVSTILSLPPYEEDVLYRTGLLFARAGRPWEAVAALDTIASLDPDSDRGQDAFVESMQVLIDPLEKYDQAEERGIQFLNAFTRGRGPRRVAHAMTSLYQKQERWKDVKSLLPVIDAFVPSTDEVVLQYDCELYYMQAIADIVLLRFDEARAGFERVMTDYPDSHQQENAMYWHAMAQLFLKAYPAALEEYDAYTERWPEGTWLPSVAFHSGVCLFAMERYDESMERFTHVINTYPDADVYSDACAMRGDLLASQGELPAAQADYEEAIAKARMPRQATYAVFQMTTMFELEERYDEILEVVNAYLERYGEEADVAKAAYWIGKTKLAQGLTAEAVEAYRKTIVAYGGDVAQDGVDLIITELLSVSKRLLEEDELEALKASLRTSLEETDNITLQLRLRVLLAAIEDRTLELGKELIVELENFEEAPPPVLSVICDASFEEEDFSRAEELLDLFQVRYEESDFMRSALKLRAYGLLQEEKYEPALAMVAETQARYGTEPSAAWAQIMKGRIELQQEKFDEARETYESMLSVRDWRGEPYAEATYYLGQVEEAAGNSRKAFGWYQRLYTLYKGYANGYWAAEGYLASAECLRKMGLENDMRNTYRGLLFDKYVNHLPQADVARNALGPTEVDEISALIAQGIHTNITVQVAAPESAPDEMVVPTQQEEVAL